MGLLTDNGAVATIKEHNLQYEAQLNQLANNLVDLCSDANFIITLTGAELTQNVTGPQCSIELLDTKCFVHFQWDKEQNIVMANCKTIVGPGSTIEETPKTLLEQAVRRVALAESAYASPSAPLYNLQRIEKSITTQLDQFASEVAKRCSTLTEVLYKQG